MPDKLFCPRCGGRDIGYAWDNPVLVRLGAPLPRRCQDCGLSAMIFPAEPEEEPRGEISEADSQEYHNAVWYAIMLLLFFVLFYLLFR
jgi:hypothetical protein